ncbi:hypothetical protein ILYODFUR_028606, partial [Ilyodon furcidens]
MKVCIVYPSELSKSRGERELQKDPKIAATCEAQRRRSVQDLSAVGTESSQGSRNSSRSSSPSVRPPDKRNSRSYFPHDDPT